MTQMLLKSSAVYRILLEPTTCHCLHISQLHSTELSSFLFVSVLIHQNKKSRMKSNELFQIRCKYCYFEFL